MASKKRKSQGKASPKPQSDPWFNWCAPAQGADKQRFLDNAEVIPEPLAICDALFDADELFYARLAISNAAYDIFPEAHDAEVHPVPALESLEVNSEKQFTLSRISEQTFCILKHISEVWPHPNAVERLKNLANEMVQLLYAAREFGRKKIELATTMKRKDAAEKLKKAYKNFCMIDLTGDIDTDAKHLFLEQRITPDGFRAAMRRAFMLDRQATEKINSKPLEKSECRMPIEKFAKLCGVSLRIVKYWNVGKGRIPTVFHPVLKRDVAYSSELLDDPIEAERFAMLYKERKRIKRAERKKIAYREEETDRANERQKRGIPPSTHFRESDYDGVARDSDSATRLGYKSGTSSSWGT